MSTAAQMPHLGQLITETLQLRGMTKAEFGRRINTSRQNVSLILRKQSMDVGLLWKICHVLKIDLFQILSLAAEGEGHPGLGGRGSMAIRLELADKELVHLTADLIRNIIHKP